MHKSRSLSIHRTTGKVGKLFKCSLILALAVFVNLLPTAIAKESKLNEVVANLRYSTNEYVSIIKNQHIRRLAELPDVDITEAANKANAIGSSVRNTMRQIRGGSDKFYSDLVEALNIMYCDDQTKSDNVEVNPRVRFVGSDSVRAYKDANGECIRLKVTAFTDTVVKAEYAQGQCETIPNCYWSDIDPNDVDRVPVYSVEEAESPVEGNMTYQDAKDFLMKWTQGLMVFIVPGIILGALSMITLVLFLFCRCCCNSCGGRYPREGGYTVFERLIPVIFFLVFAGAVIVCAAVSLLYNKNAMSAVQTTFDTSSETLGTAIDWIASIRTPMILIRDKVIDSADSVRIELNGTDFIEEGLSGLTNILDEFSANSADRTLPKNCVLSDEEPYCLPCIVCTTISDEVGKASNQINEKAGDGINELKSIRGQLDSLLVEAADSVRAAVDSQVDESMLLTDEIERVRAQVDDAQDQYNQQEAVQQWGILGLFVLSFLVIALGLLGVLFGVMRCRFLVNIMHIAYIIGFIALFLTFIISSVSLAVSVVLGDVCEVASIFSEDFTVFIGEPGVGLNACFRNESLIDAFNLSSQLEFARGGLVFPEGQNMNEMLDFTELDTFSNTILATNESTFPLDEEVMETLINGLNNYTTQNDNACIVDWSYNSDTILEPWTAHGESPPPSGTTREEYMINFYDQFDTLCTTPGDGLPFQCSKGQNPCTFSAFIGEIYHSARMLSEVKQDAGGFITELHNNITVVTDFTNTFKTKTKKLDAAINAIKADLEVSLIKYVDDFEKAMYCTFIADGYYEIYSAFCGEWLTSFTMISLVVFLSGIFLFPVNVSLIIACKRLKASGNGELEEDMKFK